MNKPNKRGMAKATITINKTKRTAKYLLPRTRVEVARHYFFRANGQ